MISRLRRGLVKRELPEMPDALKRRAELRVAGRVGGDVAGVDEPAGLSRDRYLAAVIVEALVGGLVACQRRGVIEARAVVATGLPGRAFPGGAGAEVEEAEAGADL